MFDLKHEILYQLLTNGTDNTSEELSLLKKAKYVVNHPLHVYNQDRINPSSFIPFCKFGGNFSLLNTISSLQFSIPTCNAFKPRLFGDQVFMTILYCIKFSENHMY